MIEPFEPGQVREVDGKRIVSYGTSSYGYDIRCSQRIQDLHQHQLDHRRSRRTSTRSRSSTSKGDVCIIPPNSFALARTVEYFRIPRNVLTDLPGQVAPTRAAASSST